MKAIYQLVGNRFRGQAEQTAFKALRKGDGITLVREPTNEHDSNAVKAMIGELHVAYVKADDARVLSNIMDTDHHTQVNGDAQFLGALTCVEVQHADY